MNKKISNLRNKIKDYTKSSPVLDYRIYLSNCKKLLQLDTSLNSLENLEDSEEKFQIIISIEEKVNEIISL